MISLTIFDAVRSVAAQTARAASTSASRSIDAAQALFGNGRDGQKLLPGGQRA